MDAVSDKAISQAIGAELRRARSAKGWSRGYLVKRLPSGIGSRTLLSYEHGTRHMTVLRLIEVCRVLGVGAPHLLTLGLQRAHIYVENLALWVDLKALVVDDTTEFLSMVMWAHNKLIGHPAGVVQVTSTAVAELATLMGTSHSDLAAYLTRFTPELDQIPESEEDRIWSAP